VKSKAFVAFKYQAQNNINLPNIQGHWAQTYIEALAARDIIAGYPDGNYRPENLVHGLNLQQLSIKLFPQLQKDLAAIL
jgi:hypothetical protein